MFKITLLNGKLENPISARDNCPITSLVWIGIWCKTIRIHRLVVESHFAKFCGTRSISWDTEIAAMKKVRMWPTC